MREEKGKEREENKEKERRDDVQGGKKRRNEGRGDIKRCDSF